jgi:hypothetical protein
VARNKLVLNISKAQSIVFETNHSLNPEPQLNIVMIKVEIEQVEVTKLPGVTLVNDQHIDTTGAEIGRKTVHIKALICLLNSTINMAGPTGHRFVSPGLLFSCVVRYHKKGLTENCN